VNGSLLTPIDRATAIACSMALAAITYRFVEYPIRHSSNLRVPQGLAIAMASLGAIGLAIFSGYIDSRLKNQNITQILAATYDWEYPPVAAEDHFIGATRYFIERSKLDTYTLFIGDSNMEQYAPRIDQAIKDNPEGLNGAILATSRQRCRHLSVIVSGANLCPEEMSQLQALIRQKSTRAVAIAASWITYPEELTGAENQKRFTEFLRSVAETKPVYLILNTPNGEELAPENMFTGSRLGEITSKPVTGINFDFSRFDQRYAAIKRILATIAENSGAILIDPIPYLCPQEHCPIFDKNGKPLYRDSSHLTRSYVINAATYIDKTLNPSTARKEGRTQ
jgi:hypothetical protein